MAITTTNITGDIALPDGTIPSKSSVTFVMTGFDTDASADTTIAPRSVTSVLSDTGALDVDLWSNQDGERTTFYNVRLNIYNGNSPKVFDVGKIEVPTTGGPYDLNDLLPIAPPSGATVDEYIAQLAASVASAEAAADTAVAAATPAAELIANVRVTRDEVSDLAGVTASDLGVGDYARVMAADAVYQRAADAATDFEYDGAAGVRFKRAPKPHWAEPMHSVGGISRLVLDMLTSPSDGGGSVSFSDVRILGMGSSVGAGANVTGAVGPVDAFASSFRTHFDRLGFDNITADNQSVPGDAIIQGFNDWDDGTITAGGANICVHIWGMNDAGTAIFNAGQTFPGSIRFLTQLCIQQVRDGVTPVLVTSVHPHTQRRDYSMPSGVTMSWPRSVAAPVPDTETFPTVVDSVVTLERNGVSINADAKMLMINDAMRAVASLVPGTVLIDAEPYWFDAVATYGEDALYVTDGGGTGESVHPNALGHRLGYYRAFDDALRIASMGIGFEQFQGPQHPQIIAGLDAQRISQLLRDELLPTAPLAVAPTSDFSNSMEIYARDRQLDQWIVPDDGNSTPGTDGTVPNLVHHRRTWNADRSSSFVSQDWREAYVNQAAGTVNSLTISDTRAAGTVHLSGWSSTNNGTAKRTYQFTKNGTSWELEELGTGATSGAGATYFLQVTTSGDDLQFQNELSGTRYQAWVEYSPI